MQSISENNKVFISFIVALYASVSLLSALRLYKKESNDSHSSYADSTFTGSDTPDADLCEVSDRQESEQIEVDQELQLSLAKVCVSESGFQVRTNDCTLIYHVLRGRSVTGEVSMGIMRAYARKTFDINRKDSRRWIVNLNSRFEEPEGWSENVTIPWEVRRPGFIEVYNHAGELLRNRPTQTPCGVKVSHWGARGFRRDLHLNRGWRLVECGRTNNDFWVVPSRQNVEETEQEIIEDIEEQEMDNEIPDLVEIDEE